MSTFYVLSVPRHRPRACTHKQIFDNVVLTQITLSLGRYSCDDEKDDDDDAPSPSSGAGYLHCGTSSLEPQRAEVAVEYSVASACKPQSTRGRL